ncbi:MAG: shikimate dehydrogenase [Chitinophagales bacterium]|nr:shikimate dehydrogenase [Chitinophagales bacterium]
MQQERHFGLMGWPLAHSFSRQYFTEKFRNSGLTHCRYDNYPIEAASLMPQLFRNDPLLEGLNVTVPYKQQVMAFLDDVDQEAARIGAVNCIRRINDRLIGYNTDLHGFLQAVRPLLRPWHRAALVLGSGGAAKAVAAALRQLNISYQIVSRFPGEHVIAYDDLQPPVLQHYLLIVNATPLGMYPNVHSMPPLPVQALTGMHLVVDLVYNPPVTRLMAEAAKAGATVTNGWDMLVLQAEKSWEIWNS